MEWMIPALILLAGVNAAQAMAKSRWLWVTVAAYWIIVGVYWFGKVA